MPSFKSKLLVVSARRAQGTIEATQKSYSFTKFMALDTAPEDENVRGMSVSEYRLPYEAFSNFTHIPGVYEVEGFSDSKGTTITSAKCVNDYQLKF